MAGIQLQRLGLIRILNSLESHAGITMIRDRKDQSNAGGLKIYKNP